MDRIIAPYGSAATVSITKGPSALTAPAAHPPKSGGDYIRALRKRWWVTVVVALPVFSIGTILVLRQQAMYQAVAQIKIVPPQFDPVLSVIVDSAANLNRDNAEQFVQDKIAQLRSKGLIDSVVREFEPGDSAAASDLAAELIGGLSTRRMPGTNSFLVTLEGRDQDQVAELLNHLLAALNAAAYSESQNTLRNSIESAKRSLDALRKQMGEIDRELGKLLAESPHFAPGRRNLAEEELTTLRSVLLQKRIRYEDLAYEKNLAEVWPGLRGSSRQAHPLVGELKELTLAHEQFEQHLRNLQRTLRGRNFRTDPYVRWLYDQQGQVRAGIAAVQRELGGAAPPDLADLNLQRAAEEIVQYEEEVRGKLALLQGTASQFQSFIGLEKRRDQLELLTGQMEDRRLKFESVESHLLPTVVIDQFASEPLAPVRPNRALGIVLTAILSVGLGLGLVLTLEACDHAVRIPEHISAGLDLPLLSVVPRLRRLARTSRGGHLWVQGLPESPECDAFRNLRASLLGAESFDNPHSVILITSAKSGEGKSTTALNLAAAFARSGERTILVDCDLRTPTLAEVFDVEADLGIVDVLSGAVPWRNAVVECAELPGLVFLPAGHLGGLPIEILGSLELKQLVVALSRHYHRVILDGPAVLGLAEGRMLGRIADVTLLVVRCGIHDLRPLRRAGLMLEQSRVHVGGVVFNDVSDGFHDWTHRNSTINSSLRSPAGRIGRPAALVCAEETTIR
jgi:succinoglycan biosynthesis transport protein ExoP